MPEEALISVRLPYTMHIASFPVKHSYRGQKVGHDFLGPPCIKIFIH